MSEKVISVLGSTGSIGEQALDVARLHGYRINALTAAKNVDILENQVSLFVKDTLLNSDPIISASYFTSLTPNLELPLHLSPPAYAPPFHQDNFS